jgi:hypothetical protein
LFEFEYLRNKREGTFANLSKLVNKFVAFLVETRISQLSENVMETGDCKDKFSTLKGKISEYLITYREIASFFQEKDTNVKLIEKFIPSFKLNRFTIDEGKEKIIKKFKESLDKSKIAYNDVLLNSIIIPKGEDEGYVLIRDNKENSVTGMQSLQLGENVSRLSAKEDALEPYPFFDGNQYLSPRMGNAQGSVFNSQNVPLYINGNLEASIKSAGCGSDFNFGSHKTEFNFGMNNYIASSPYILHEQGLPVMSRTFLVKQYNKTDFPEDDNAN